MLAQGPAELQETAPLIHCKSLTLNNLNTANSRNSPLRRFVALRLRTRGVAQLANLFGAFIGAAIDREEGGSGMKGAIEGTIAEYAIRALAPIVATYALGWAVQYGMRKGWHALVGRDPLDEQGQLKPRPA